MITSMEVKDLEGKFVASPKPLRSENITIRVDEALRKKLEEIAEKYNCSRNELINQMLHFAVDSSEFK